MLARVMSSSTCISRYKSRTQSTEYSNRSNDLYSEYRELGTRVICFTSVRVRVQSTMSLTVKSTRHEYEKLHFYEYITQSSTITSKIPCTREHAASTVHVPLAS
jgi:hypothetical protein